MRSILAAFAVMAILAGPVMAQDLPSSKDLTKVSSGVYTLDKSHASILFKINHLGFSMYHGRFNDFDATLNFDAKNPEASKVDVTINLDSIDTNNAELQDKLKGEKFFNTKVNPKASFRSLRTTKTGADTGSMIGELTLNGVPKPVTLEVRFHGGGTHPFTKKPVLGFSATGAIKRSEWGVKEYLPMVGDDVVIEIEAEFNGKDAAPEEPKKDEKK